MKNARVSSKKDPLPSAQRRRFAVGSVLTALLLMVALQVNNQVPTWSLFSAYADSYGSSSATPYCGDGTTNGGEECDDDNDDDTDGCYSCLNSICGNGRPGEPRSDGTLEDCDLGAGVNGMPGETCSATCENVSTSSSSSSSSSSSAPFCGDGTTDPGEECDDGNAYDFDGCYSCLESACGNYRDSEPRTDGSFEECDDGSQYGDGTPCAELGGISPDDGSVCAPVGNDGCSAMCDDDCPHDLAALEQARNIANSDVLALQIELGNLTLQISDNNADITAQNTIISNANAQIATLNAQIAVANTNGNTALTYYNYVNTHPGYTFAQRTAALATYNGWVAYANSLYALTAPHHAAATAAYAQAFVLYNLGLDLYADQSQATADLADAQSTLAIAQADLDAAIAECSAISFLLGTKFIASIFSQYLPTSNATQSKYLPVRPVEIIPVTAVELREVRPEAQIEDRKLEILSAPPSDVERAPTAIPDASPAIPADETPTSFNFTDWLKNAWEGIADSDDSATSEVSDTTESDPPLPAPPAPTENTDIDLPPSAPAKAVAPGGRRSATTQQRQPDIRIYWSNGETPAEAGDSLEERIRVLEEENRRLKQRNAELVEEMRRAVTENPNRERDESREVRPSVQDEERPTIYQQQDGTIVTNPDEGEPETRREAAGENSTEEPSFVERFGNFLDRLFGVN